MGKILKEKQVKNTQFELVRYIKSGNFKFTIREIDLTENVVFENEYTSESVFEKFDEITFNYDFEV